MSDTVLAIEFGVILLTFLAIAVYCFYIRKKLGLNEDREE